MFEKYVALYSTGEIHSSHNERYQFPEEGLVAIISHYIDGNRDIWWNNQFEAKSDFEKAVVAHATLMTEFKHDGGFNHEIQKLRGGKQ